MILVGGPRSAARPNLTRDGHPCPFISPEPDSRPILPARHTGPGATDVERRKKLTHVVYCAQQQQVAKERGIPEEMEAVGDELPDLIPIEGSWEKMVEDTRNNVVDVLFCAMFITKARAGILDFTYPYLETGYRMVIRTRNDVGTEFDVVTGIFANPSPISYFFVLFLVILAVIYAHIMYGIALFSNTDGISTNYGHGVFDTWWLAMVTATTGEATSRNSFIIRRRLEYFSSASPAVATIYLAMTAVPHRISLFVCIGQPRVNPPGRDAFLISPGLVLVCLFQSENR
jgi:hypothetical protein